MSCSPADNKNEGTPNLGFQPTRAKNGIMGILYRIHFKQKQECQVALSRIYIYIFNVPPKTGECQFKPQEWLTKADGGKKPHVTALG